MISGSVVGIGAAHVYLALEVQEEDG